MITGSCINHHNNLAEVYGKSIVYKMDEEIDIPYECNDNYIYEPYKITLKDLLKDKKKNKRINNA
jgi:hypothetical protein